MNCNCLKYFIKIVCLSFFIFFSIPYFLQPIKASNTTNIEELVDFQFQTIPIEIINQTFDYKPELTPEIFKIGTDYYYVVSTQWTFLCKSSTNIVITKRIHLENDNCKMITQPEILNNLDSKGYPTYKNLLFVNKYHYRRNYAGVLSMHYIPEKNLIFSISAGENSNARYLYNPEFINYQNSFKPNVPVDSYYRDVGGKEWSDGCYSGYNQNGEYVHCWAALSSFVNASYLLNPNFQNFSNWNTSTFNEMGPVLWHQKNPQTVLGMYHPTSFYFNNYLYVFAVDNNPDEAEKNAQCTTLSAAGIFGNPEIWTFFNYKNGYFNSRSLPLDFTKENMLDFRYAVGGERECLFKDEKYPNGDYRDLWFSVAKIKNSNYFLGVQQRWDKNLQKLQLTIRISKNLTKWSKPTIIYEVNSTNGWGESFVFYYPRLLNEEGVTNSEIDVNNFYIFGNNLNQGGNGSLGQGKLVIKSDLNKDNKVDIADSMLVAKEFFVSSDQNKEIIGEIDTNRNNIIDINDLISTINFYVD